MKHLAIFDLDGTLLNTIEDLGVACNYALANCGYAIHEMSEYPHLVGNGVNKLIERALPEGEKSEQNIMMMREWFVPYYNQHNCVHTKPYEGIPAVLHKLHSLGWLLAVASNKYQEAAAEVVNHFFPHTFDAIYGEREAQPRKPDPTVVKNIMSELNINPTTDEVVYIGDSDVDVLTAQNAGLKMIACTWGFCKADTLQKLNPNYLINEPENILAVL